MSESELKILFLSGGDCTISGMARGILSTTGKSADSTCAGIGGDSISPEAVAVLREQQIDLSPHSGRTIDDLAGKTFDLIITLDKDAYEYCQTPEPDNKGGTFVKAPLFIGRPSRLYWDSGGYSNFDRAKLITIRDHLQQMIETLVNTGYLSTLIAHRQDTQRLLDSMTNGVIVHDNYRHIYLFNEAAERITGRKREEVLGRDCHEIFGGGLCGGQCSFQQERETTLQPHDYQVKFTDVTNNRKLLQLSISSIESERDIPGGVLAAFRDITEVSDLRWQLHEKRSFHGMIGVSPAMQEVFETIRQVVSSDYPVLVTGESGTGKELVANAIHNESRRAGREFVPINCGALPENILESELFGHVRGAFTGAIRDKKGRFELADGGTLFLDEVGELTPAFQVKLLRVLQEKRFERVGGEESISVDVRVISATNRDLRQLIKEGKFREDLYYRLCVVPIELPPLRERPEDIPPLLQKFITDIRNETGKPKLSLAPAAIEQLMRYDWPGNVRELINALRYSAIRHAGDLVGAEHLPPEIRDADGPTVSFEPINLIPSTPAEKKSRKRGKLSIETVGEALSAAGGNKVKAAKLLGVGRATLYRFLSANDL